MKVFERLEHEGETPRAYQAFLDYCEMGYGRSLAKLADRYGKDRVKAGGKQPPSTSLATIENWSSKYRWVDRAEGYDNHRRQEADKEWQERRMQIRERDYELSMRLREKALNILEANDRFLYRTTKFEKGTPKVIDKQSGKTLEKGTPDREIVTVEIRANLAATFAKLASELARTAADMPPPVQRLDHSFEEIPAPMFITYHPLASEANGDEPSDTDDDGS